MPPWRRVLLIFVLGAVAGLIVCAFIPVAFTLTKLIQLILGGVVWLGLLTLAWRIRPVRFAMPALTILGGALFLLPARPLDRAALRSDYVARLAGFEGTDYVWGGESRLGIDCSGLPRRAWRDALFQYGLTRLDGGALRLFLEQWWFDASAEALGSGYRGFTVPLNRSGTIRTMDASDLEPGDLAITTSGIHTLAYLGEGRWIQADPGIGHTASLHGQQDRNPWFTTGVKLHRWRVLQAP